MASFEIDIQHCITALEQGGVILFPTDTIWGIGCDATNVDAVDQILAIKQRPAHKGLIVLISDEKQLLDYVSQSNIQIFDYIHGINKPTTVIYSGAKNVATNILPQDGSIAIRIVKDPFCNALVARFGKPIVSTSANLNGFPSPLIFADIDNAIKTQVSYTVQHRQDDEEAREPSSVIKWTEEGTLEIIRP